MTRTEELIQKSQAGDREAGEARIQENAGLIWAIARRFLGRGAEAEDLYQLGCLGFLKAVQGFDFSYGTCFSTYAVPMIIGEVRRYQRDNNSVRVSRGVRDLAYKALQVKEEIWRVDLREATIPEIAARLEVSEKQVGEAMEAIVEPISIFDSVYGEGEDALFVIDKLADEGSGDEVLVENIALKEALKRLSPREWSIVYRRFYGGRTQMEIAEEVGISQAQVSRIEKGAMDKMRKFMG